MKGRRLLFLIPLLLASCNPSESSSLSDSSSSSPLDSSSQISSSSDETTSTSTISSSSSSAEQLVLEDARDYVEAIDSTKNFTMDLTIGQDYVLSYGFLTDTVGSYSLVDSSMDAYHFDGEGIYRIVRSNDTYTPGEYLRDDSDSLITDVYDSRVMSNFHGRFYRSADEFEDGAVEGTISNKITKTTIISVLSLSSSSILNMSDVSCSLDNYIFSMSFTIDTTSYLLQFHSFGNTTFDLVDTFLEQGGESYTPNVDVYELRRLMKSNNFMHTDINSDSTYYEVYNPRYFMYGFANSNSVSGAVTYGSDTRLLSASCDLPNTPITATDISIGMVYKSNSDVVETYHYPCYLKMWDNIQYIKEGEIEIIGFTKKGNTYIVEDDDLLADFVSNFSLDQYYPIAQYPPIGLMIDVSLGADDASTEIDFYYCFRSGNSAFVYQYKFSSFGECNAPALDEYLDNL